MISAVSRHFKLVESIKNSELACYVCAAVIHDAVIPFPGSLKEVNAALFEDNQLNRSTWFGVYELSSSKQMRNSKQSRFYLVRGKIFPCFFLGFSAMTILTSRRQAIMILDCAKGIGVYLSTSAAAKLRSSHVLLLPSEFHKPKTSDTSTPYVLTDCAVCRQYPTVLIC